MNQANQPSYLLDFSDLELRFGKDSAFSILRILEQFEGVAEARVSRLSYEERLQNVLAHMKENMRYQNPPLIRRYIMQYQELHQRYGSHIAKRVQTELHFSEFNQVMVEELTTYLEMRAEAAHKEYHVHLGNPFSKEELRAGSAPVIDSLYSRWRAAEELAYLLTIAEDVSSTARASVTVS